MLGIVYAPGLFGFSALFGRDPLTQTCHGMALSLCKPHRNSPRYKQMVAYYSWKLEKRYERSLAYKSWVLTHDAVLYYALILHLARALHVLGAVMKQQ